jgi:predicted amidophosphoribosyltransferase
VTPAVSESATKTCPHCGATLARVVNFCNQCGRPLRNA